MPTTQHTRHTRPDGRGPISVLVVAALGIALLGLGRAGTTPFHELEGRDANQRDSLRPKISATFPRESYKPGSRARLSVYSNARGATLQIFRAGHEKRPTRANDLMAGSPVTNVIPVGQLRAGRPLGVRIGNWPSGVYFAELTASGGRVGYAPFVLRPRRLGEHRVAIVMPTQTWQAYNFRDDDEDGEEDTWYIGGNTARLARPFLNRGVPYHYKHYDAPFLRWLARMDYEADYLSDADLDAIGSGRKLARNYALLIFPGHHEYVTKREYDAVTGFRNRGGNLVFLSANNFYWKIERRGNLMTRVAKWRDLGRPEAALIGVQYFFNDLGERRDQWVVRTPLPWLFKGTGLGKGSRFSSGGIEADRTYGSSPRGLKVVAEIPNLYGRGMTAQMTYYERRGAKVFAAGAFTLAGAIWQPPVRSMMENVWSRLANDQDTGSGSLEKAA